MSTEEREMLFFLVDKWDTLDKLVLDAFSNELGLTQIVTFTINHILKEVQSITFKNETLAKYCRERADAFGILFVEYLALNGHKHDIQSIREKTHPDLKSFLPEDGE